MTLARALASVLSPRGARGALSVLIFHRVRPEPDELFPEEPDHARFDAQLSWLGSMFNVLPLDAAVQRLESGSLPARAAAITFDDGYADNEAIALPVLRKHGMKATFFIASAFLDGGRMWNDTVIEAVRRCRASAIDLLDLNLGHHVLESAQARRRAIHSLLASLKYRTLQERHHLATQVAERCQASLPDDLMLTGAQVKALRAAGMSIGGHTRTHPILSNIPDEVAMQEIAGGKADLESLLGESITLFAYPNGTPGRDYGVRHAVMAKEAGYVAAVSTSSGVARSGTDVFQLPRFTPWDRSAVRYGLRLVGNLRHSAAITT
jgi:peptidoglycan/xylan/chitin deacetylase (PgdA/CDA1 family)